MHKNLLGGIPSPSVLVFDKTAMTMMSVPRLVDCVAQHRYNLAHYCSFVGLGVDDHSMMVNADEDDSLALWWWW